MKCSNSISSVDALSVAAVALAAAADAFESVTVALVPAPDALAASAEARPSMPLG